MKAIVYRRYGPPDVLKLEDVPEPKHPPKHVRVRVTASAVNPKDVLVRKGKFKFITRNRFPRTPGYDFSGTVIDPGGHPSLETGDAVYGMINHWDGGTAANVITVPWDEIAKAPPNIPLVEAAALPLASLTALQALRDLIQVRPGHRVLIHGASGGVGTLAIQIAVALGARVTTTSSDKNLDFVRSLGAEKTLDYKDPTPLPNDAFDGFFDVFGNRSYKKVRAHLTKTGRYVTTVPSGPAFGKELLSRILNGPERLVLVKSRAADLDQITTWVKEGRVKPVIDRLIPLEEIADAHRHLETKRARGKVILTLETASD